MNAPTRVVGQAKFASDIGFPLFSAGQMLYHDDLAALADYTRQITRLMMRSLFGCGVVCGLCVKATIACNKLTVVVEPGVALDCDGDPVHVPKTTTITVDPGCETLEGPLWVILRGFEKCCVPRPSVCASDDDEVPSACTREQYWYEIQVRGALPECVCRCTPPESSGESYDASEEPCQCADPTLDCHKDHYAGKCTCACPDCAACKCEWILLARLDEQKADPENPWRVNHRWRRFVRPVLMRDLGCCPEETRKEEQEHAHEENHEEQRLAETKVKARRSHGRKAERAAKGSTSSTG